MPECGHGYPALRWDGQLDNGDPLPFEVLAASEFVGREMQSGRLQLQPGDAGQTTGLRRFGTRPGESSANRSKPRAPNTVVVSCASCRLNFMAAAETDQWPTRIASLVELVAEQLPKGKEL